MTDTLDAIAREKFAHTLSRMLLRRERTGAVTERGQRFVKAERDALQAAITALSNQGEGAEPAGPWEALRVSGKVVVASEDFGNDVWLYVSGDFDDDDAELEYAASIASRLNAKPAEADRRDAERFYAACQRAAAELPYDWEIRICLENGAGTVELCAPDGEVTHMDVDSDDRLTAEINAAIDAATQEQT